MSKQQIKLTQEGIRKMISEAIKAYSFNGEGFNDKPDDEFDEHGNPKYPEGVFSTDSEEGEAFKERAKKYDKPEGNELVWNQRERKLKDVEDSVTGSKWANTHDSLWDTDRKLDKMARDEFGDEEAEGQLYDKPFGNMDDIENQWSDEPGYEEKDEDDDDIAGISEGKIRLTEEGLRKFVSYSVARLLKEAYGRQFDDGRDGIDYENSKYGDDSMEIEFDPWEDDNQMKAFQSVVNEAGLQMEMFDDGGRFGDMWPVPVKVHYTVSQGMKGSYDVPSDPDEIKVTGWDAGTKDLPPKVGKLIDKVLEAYFKDGYFDPEEQIRLNEANLGVTTHFNGESDFKPENPYKDMTWDEYCEAKRGEHEEEQMKAGEPEDDSSNLGVTSHYNGEKPESNPEDDEHMFDDQYWVDKEKKMNLSQHDLQEMVKKAVKSVIKRLK